MITDQARTHELAARVRGRAASDRPLAARGSGTLLGRGLPPGREPEWVDMSPWNQVVAYDHEDLTITVGAGTPLHVLDDALREHGQWLTADPLPSAHTVGGLIGADRRTPLAGTLGSVRDVLLGVTAVTGAGEVVRAGGRVVKNVAGYDLMRPLIGSLSQFALLTEVTLKLNPAPQFWGGRVLARDAITAGTVSTLRAQHIEPTAVWWVRDPAGERTVMLFAGSEARVHGQVRRLEDTGIDGRTLSPEDALAERDHGLRFASEGSTPRMWGGVLPEVHDTLWRALLGVALLDLQSGLFWSSGGTGSELTEMRARLGAAGHAHRDASSATHAFPDAWGSDPGAELQLWRGLKHAFDPHARLVGGRLPGGV